MSLLNKLLNDELWQDFLTAKREKGFMPKSELSKLEKFISDKNYKAIAERILRDGFYFDRPERKLVNKKGTTKKRVVYTFPNDETFILKFLASGLNKYNYVLSPNCFSFRKDLSIRAAIGNLVGKVKSGEFYCYKLDIQNYFNSIDVQLILPKLKLILADDLSLYNFFEKLLIWNDQQQHGVMAGTPTSPFLSNIYLIDLDKHFENLGVPYARYADDIIVFAPTLEVLTEYKNYMINYLETVNLKINPNKEQIFQPHTPWNFLGIEYRDGKIDLSQSTIEKVKAKIRRKARAINRWRHAKNAPAEKAMKVMIRVYNKKFFENAGTNDLTWCRWYFPLLTTDKGLQTVDNYLQEQLRFLITNRHVGTNNKQVPYEQLKSLGYRTLVNSFHI